ncbi:hypothetical protein HG531_008306 [Fusarium graminearum]|nr:hypothetical protein HG531_008306 [Fusarium graminearum]
MFSQGNTSCTSIGLTEVKDEEHASEKGNQVSNKISPEGQPSIASPQVDKGSTLNVDLFQIVSNESSLVTISSNGCHATEGFAELLEKGTALNGLKSLEVARGTKVEGSDEIEQYRNTGGGIEELGRDVCDEANCHPKRNATADHTNGNGCDLLINSLQILAETVHQLTERGDIEELELGPRDRCNQPVVKVLRCSQRTQEYPKVSEQGCKSTSNSDDSEDSQVVHSIDVLLSGLHEDGSIELFRGVVCRTKSDRVGKADLGELRGRSGVLETNAPDAILIHVVQAELNVLVSLFFHKELLNTVDGNLGFLDVSEHVTELIQRDTKKHKEGDGREGDRRLQGLVLNKGVNEEREERNEDGHGVPNSNSQCPDHESRAQRLELSLTLLINDTAKALLPSKVLDDANVLQHLVGDISTLVGGCKDSLGSDGETTSKAIVDGQKENHDDDTRDGTETHDLPEQNNGNNQLSRCRGTQEVEVSCNLGDLETVNGHEVDNGSQIGLLVVGIVLLVILDAVVGGFGVVGCSLLIVLHAQRSLDLAHETIRSLVALCGFRLVFVEQHLVLASSSLATEGFGINVANDEGSDSDTNLATNPESLVIGI